MEVLIGLLGLFIVARYLDQHLAWGSRMQLSGTSVGGPNYFSLFLVYSVWSLLTIISIILIWRMWSAYRSLEKPQRYLSSITVFTILAALGVLEYDCYVIKSVYQTWTVTLITYARLLQVFPAACLILHSLIQLHVLGLEFPARPSRDQALVGLISVLFNLVMLMHFASFIFHLFKLTSTYEERFDLFLFGLSEVAHRVLAIWKFGRLFHSYMSIAEPVVEVDGNIVEPVVEVGNIREPEVEVGNGTERHPTELILKNNHQDNKTDSDYDSSMEADPCIEVKYFAIADTYTEMVYSKMKINYINDDTNELVVIQQYNYTDYPLTYLAVPRQQIIYKG